MEVPAPEAGVVEGTEGQARRQGLRGRRDSGAGDRRRRRYESTGAGSARASQAPATATAPPGVARCLRARALRHGSHRERATIMRRRSWCSGSGPGGYTAAFRAADLGKKVVLIEALRRLWAACASTSDASRRSAVARRTRVVAEAEEMSPLRPQVRQAEDRYARAARRGRTNVVAKGTKGPCRACQAAQSAGRAPAWRSSPRPHMVEVQTSEGVKKRFRFDSAIIAAGSQVGQDSRLSVRR